MGRHTSIAWATHTWNAWWGCVEHSPACDHCYAKAQAHHAIPPGWLIVGEGFDVPRRTRFGDPTRPEVWGPDAPRIFPSPSSPTHTEPLRWNREAAARGERHRVFVQSMGDICERHRLVEVNEMMGRARAHLFDVLVPACPWLDFLLLTKRPHDFWRVVPPSWREHWPQNVWAGCTVEDQTRARHRLAYLAAIPAPVRFVSAEPLLGPLDLAPWLDRIDWVILGGESGGHARAMQVEFARSVRDQCVSAEVAFFMKQWGAFAQVEQSTQLVRLRRKDERLLDGREWNELPVPRVHAT